MKTNEVIEITNAEYLDGFKISITFSDNSSKVIDFDDFLQNSHNPLTRKYLNLELFKNFKIEFGDLIWNDYELCFPIWDLYEGKI